jgi:hypothetical protein
MSGRDDARVKGPSQRATHLLMTRHVRKKTGRKLCFCGCFLAGLLPSKLEALDDTSMLACGQGEKLSSPTFLKWVDDVIDNETVYPELSKSPTLNPTPQNPQSLDCKK